MSHLAASRLIAAAVLAVIPVASAPAQAPVAAQGAPVGPAPPTYPDLADLADPAALIARVAIDHATRIPPERAGAAAPGTAVVLVEARTVTLLFGQGLGESVRYLAQVPLDGRGRLPSLRKREVIVFARPVPERPGELRLVTGDAQLPWSPVLESRVRALLGELVAPDAVPRVTGVREVLHVAGTLVGEGETRIFLATANGAPVSLNVVRRPGLPPSWGLSAGEVVDPAARPPVMGTLAWYRLACFLPPALDPATVVAGSAPDRRRAAEDYAFVRAALGPCQRNRPVR